MLLLIDLIILQVAMCNFPTIKDAADVAIATMLSGIQVGLYFKIFCFYSNYLSDFLSYSLGVKGRIIG